MIFKDRQLNLNLINIYILINLINLKRKQNKNFNYKKKLPQKTDSRAPQVPITAQIFLRNTAKFNRQRPVKPKIIYATPGHPGLIIILYKASNLCRPNSYNNIRLTVRSPRLTEVQKELNAGMIGSDPCLTVDKNRKTKGHLEPLAQRESERERNGGKLQREKEGEGERERG